MLDLMRRHSQSWLIKAIFALIILVFVLWGVGGMQGEKETVVAYVDEDPITVVEFKRAAENTLQAMRQNNPGFALDETNRKDFNQMVLSQLVNTRLLQLEAQRLGIQASNEELRRFIASFPAFKNESGDFDRDRYKALVATTGQTPAQFEAGVALEMSLDKLQAYVGLPAEPTEAQAKSLYDYLRETVKVDYVLFKTDDFMEEAKAAVTDEKAKAYYEEHKADYTKPAMVELDVLSFTPEELAPLQTVSDKEAEDYYNAHKDLFTHDKAVKARHILIAVARDADKADVDKALAKTDEIKAKIDKGGDFAAMAKEFSEGPSSVLGGELGWFEAGRMVPEFEEAAFAMSPGQVSGPVRTDFGWHLIKVEEVREPGVTSFKEAKPEIVSALTLEKASDQMNQLLDAGLDLAAAGKDLAEIGRQLKLPVARKDPMSKQDLTSVAGLSAKDAEALFAMLPGEVAKAPLNVPDGYIMAQVRKSIPPEPIPFDKARADIDQILSIHEAATLAKLKAEACLVMLTGEKKLPEDRVLKAMKAELKPSESFGRTGFIPGLGENKKLANAAFSATGDQWFSETYAFPSGFALAKPGERTPPTGEDWERDKAQWTAQLGQGLRQQLFNAFLVQLRDKAKIELVRGDILN